MITSEKKTQEYKKKYSREYYLKNKEVIKTRAMERYRMKMRTEEDKKNHVERCRLYYRRNKETFTKNSKKNYADNREARKKRANEKMECECGGRFTCANKNIHIKTKKHLKHLEDSKTIKIKIIN